MTAAETTGDAAGAGRHRPTAPSALFTLLAQHRFGIQLSIDAAAWAVALTFAVLVRVAFDVTRVDAAGLLATVLALAAAQAVAGVGSGLYLGRRRFGSFEEVAVLARTVAAVAAVLVAGTLLWPGVRPVPLSAALAGPVMALALMGGARYGWRLLIERRLRPDEHDRRSALVFGAGEAGEQLATAVLRNPGSPFVPVAFLDDDPAKARLKVRGVPVAGTRHDLGDVATAFGADALLVAIPGADAALLRDLAARARQASLPIKVLPPVDELLAGQVGPADIRPLTEADLLGRHEVDTDLTVVAGYLSSRRVLITGAGGSIGSELARQIHRFAPAELVLVDRDESALHDVQLSLAGHAALNSPEVELLDVRDRARVREVVAAHRPHVVFHAAALKHVPALERHPAEAVKTNVVGTRHVLDAAADAGVERFVNVSTDKAANPASVLGYTKRIAERLTAASAPFGAAFLSVRFGNVLGSRGSVLTAFREQIARGGPVTVTHPEITRFFMTVEEAVQLVVQAGAIGAHGETLVLDMGEPVRIAEIAEQLVAEAEEPVEIRYTGLRPGDKLHEELFDANEHVQRRSHPLISHVASVPLDPHVVEELHDSAEAHRRGAADELVARLRHTAAVGRVRELPAAVGG